VTRFRRILLDALMTVVAATLERRLRKALDRRGIEA
jgi:hypothetical protein